MLFDAGEPAQNPVLLQTRLSAVTAMLEERTSAAARLQGERDALRAERDSFRTERDTANAEVEKLQLIIRDLIRNRYGARSEKLDPDQLQLALEAVAQSLGLTERTETLDRRPGEHIGTLFPRKHPRSAKAAPQFPLRHEIPIQKLE